MNILKTVIRVLLVIICVALFVFLSITLFKFIPKAINQLASATVSLGRVSKTATSTDDSPTTEQRVPTPVEQTEGGLNGVITQPATTTGQGDIVILEKPTKPTSPYKYAAPTYTYHPAPTHTVSYSGRKNLSILSSGVGIINPSTGQFVLTNSFRSSDTVSVRFTVLNTEDTPTGAWSLQVNMPSLGVADRVRVLDNIGSIPGQSSYTVEARFDGIDLSNGTPVVRIYADPNNAIAETNESDNSLNVTLANVQTDGTYTGGTVYNGGIANLTIASLETGRMYGDSFSPTTSFGVGERITLKARIRNTGGSYTNVWSTRGSFSGGDSGYREFSTNGEQPIRSGGETIFYYTIDNVGRGSNTFNLTLDSQNNVYEANEGDNTSSVTAYISY